MWTDPGYGVQYSIIAVSQTNDPAGAWYFYQYSTCDEPFENNVDQPHLGFNSQWIVVNAECPNGVNGTGLAVFNSPYLYAGQPLDGNSYFKFHDLYDTNTAHRDNPANTYATNEAREYLTEAYLNTLSQANVNYSYLDGPANAPVYHGGAFYLNTLVRVTPNVFNPPLTIGFVQTDVV